jgi:hypothetical protein
MGELEQAVQIFPPLFFHNITSTPWKTGFVKKCGKMKLRKNTFSHNFLPHITSSLTATGEKSRNKCNRFDPYAVKTYTVGLLCCVSSTDRLHNSC